VADGTYETGSTIVYGAMQNRIALVHGVEVRSLNGREVTTIVGHRRPVGLSATERFAVPMWAAAASSTASP
jgi:hypothetical protein